MRKRRAEYDAMIRAGMSVTEIARTIGITESTVYDTLGTGFRQRLAGPIGPHLTADGPRPEWSYPDDGTLMIVRDTKTEMESGETPPYKPAGI